MRDYILDCFEKYECCANCKNRKDTDENGFGYCKKLKEDTECDDYCGYWKESRK